MNEEIERKRMEKFYNERLKLRGVTIAWGRDKKGRYISEYAQDAWAAWNTAIEIRGTAIGQMLDVNRLKHWLANNNFYWTAEGVIKALLRDINNGRLDASQNQEH